MKEMNPKTNNIYPKCARSFVKQKETIKKKICANVHKDKKERKKTKTKKAKEFTQKQE